MEIGKQKEAVEYDPVESDDDAPAEPAPVEAPEEVPVES